MKSHLSFMIILGITALLSCHKDAIAPAKTDDTPSVWKKLDTDTTLRSFQRVLFINEDIGFVTGGYKLDSGTSFKAFLLKTTNGGQTWKEIKVTPPTFSGFDDFFILNSHIIYATGVYNGNTPNDTLALFKSTDGGETWNKINGDYHHHPGRIYFKDEQNGIATTFDSIYQTADGGITWTEMPNPDHLDISILNRTVFTSANIGYALLGSYYAEFTAIVNYGIVKKTTDGGKTWQDISANISKNLSFIIDKFFIDDNTGFLFTINKEVFRTLDGGTTWELMNNHLPDWSSGCHFFDTLEGYANLNIGIYHTKDGGRTWTHEYGGMKSPYGITWLSFPSPKVGYAVSNKGFVLKKIIP